jgi:hypothetical protein
MTIAHSSGVLPVPRRRPDHSPADNDARSNRSGDSPSATAQLLKNLRRPVRWLGAPLTLVVVFFRVYPPSAAVRVHPSAETEGAALNNVLRRIADIVWTATLIIHALLRSIPLRQRQPTALDVEKVSPLGQRDAGGFSHTPRLSGSPVALLNLIHRRLAGHCGDSRLKIAPNWGPSRKRRFSLTAYPTGRWPHPFDSLSPVVGDNVQGEARNMVSSSAKNGFNSVSSDQEATRARRAEGAQTARA